MIWTKSKVNHVFVFEFDTRHALEWRQLLEVISIPLSPQTMVMPDSQQLPSFFFFLLGLFMWLNFLAVNDMYTYWPVVLVGLTLIILFLPFRVLYHRSRKWWAYSNVSANCCVAVLYGFSLTMIVASCTCRSIPSGVPGLLPWRYVLFSDLCHGGEYWSVLEEKVMS